MISIRTECEYMYFSTFSQKLLWVANPLKSCLRLNEAGYTANFQLQWSVYVIPEVYSAQYLYRNYIYIMCICIDGQGVWNFPYIVVQRVESLWKLYPSQLRFIFERNRFQSKDVYVHISFNLCCVRHGLTTKHLFSVTSHYCWLTTSSMIMNDDFN